MSDLSIKLKSWILAARPKTLLASIVPVMVGSAAAANVGSFKLDAALIALICSVLIQVSTNFINDLYDHLAGSDTDDRLGPQRALASGLISISEMRFAIRFIFALTFLLGLYLVYIAGYSILIVGILSLLAGYAYTAGPYPLAYNGLGDLFVIIFFGFVGTVGTYFVQTLSLSTISLFASIPVGALITNILVVNNYRDHDEDKKSNKNTLVVIFGKTFGKIEFIFLLTISYLSIFYIYFLSYSYFVFLPLLTLPLAIKITKDLFSLQGEILNNVLASAAKLSFIFGLLQSLGLLL